MVKSLVLNFLNRHHVGGGNRRRGRKIESLGRSRAQARLGGGDALGAGEDVTAESGVFTFNSGNFGDGDTGTFVEVGEIGSIGGSHIEDLLPAYRGVCKKIILRLLGLLSPGPHRYHPA